VSVLVLLNEAVFVAGTLVMQSCTGDSSYLHCQKSETEVFSSKPNRNRPTLASMKP